MGYEFQKWNQNKQLKVVFVWYKDNRNKNHVMAEIYIWELIENNENYELWTVYGVLTVTRGLFEDTDWSTAVHWF